MTSEEQKEKRREWQRRYREEHIGASKKTEEGEKE